MRKRLCNSNYNFIFATWKSKYTLNYDLHPHPLQQIEDFP